MRFLKIFLLNSTILFSLVSFPVFAKDNQLQAARVLSVGDGDTIRVVNNGQKITIRLACIDAPEGRQAGGKQSTDRLKELLPVGKNIFYRAIQSDRYQRLVAEIFIDNQSVNLQMVKEGQAVVYKKYLQACKSTQNQYLKAELNAKNNHLNFWNQNTPMMPWDFRNMTTTTISIQLKLPQVSNARTPRCKDFNTRAEVINFLKKHPEYQSRLDRDNDGVACESVGL